MEFKEWFFNEIAATSFVVQRKKQIYDISKKYFGKPLDLLKSGTNLNMEFQFGNKALTLTWEWRDPTLKRETMNISFSDEEMETSMSNKDLGTPFKTAINLQSGSVNFARNLREFTKELKILGVNVTYSTWGRRNDVYSKFLSKAGFSRVIPKNTEKDDYWWLAH